MMNDMFDMIHEIYAPHILNRMDNGKHYFQIDENVA